MKESTKRLTGRRSFLRASAGLMGAAFWAYVTLEALPQDTQTNSRTSDLKITDLRVTVISRAPFTVPILRIDTNRGISGFGEVLEII